MASSGLIAAGFGVGCLLLINLAPTLIWGEEILLVSPYFTGLPSMAAGLFVFAWLFKNVLGWLDYGFEPPRKSPAAPQAIFMGITLAAGAAAIYIATNGLHPQFFDLAWREQIRLGNGELKVVETRRTYERTGWRLHEFKDVRLLNTELSFEPAPGEAKVSIKTPLQPVYLNQFDRVWYVVLVGPDKGLNPENPGRPKDGWGSDYNTMGQRLAILNGQQFEPAPWEKAPKAMVFRNLLAEDIYDLPSVIATGQRVVNLDEKQTLSYRYVHTASVAHPLRITRSEAMKTPMLAEYRQAIDDLIKPP
ncbi:MAG: hypothetical protein ABI893_08685 [Polaromonas sp.]|uniref:hypothetical protein n=1 Tax=Polaromonas sp. TaxID=1869339 RepID=UPI0032638341